MLSNLTFLDVDECLLEKAVCMFGGVCSNTIGSFKCVCPPGRSGPTCVIGMKLWKFTNLLKNCNDI